MPANLPPNIKRRKKNSSGVNGRRKDCGLEDLISTVRSTRARTICGPICAGDSPSSTRNPLSSERRRAAGGTVSTMSRRKAPPRWPRGIHQFGKSSLLACLTKATPVIADYPSRRSCPSRMMPYETSNSSSWISRHRKRDDGRLVSGIIRIADGLLVVVDLAEDAPVQLELILDQLERWNIRTRPEKSDEFRGSPGGPSSWRTRKTSPGGENFGKLKEASGISTHGCRLLPEKRGAGGSEARDLQALGGHPRLFKAAGKAARPLHAFTVPVGCTVTELAEKIHKEFIVKMKFARIWAPRSSRDEVERNYVLKDRDIVEINS